MIIMMDIAKEDGIRISHDGSHNSIVYHPKCILCNKEMNSSKYKRENEYICERCKNKVKYAKKIKSFNDTVNKFKVNYPYYIDKYKEEYEDAFAIIKNKVEEGHRYDSKEEILVAIQLEKEGIHYRHHVKISNHVADFLLMDLHIVLEVDGHIYHTDYEKDNEIDKRVINELGDDWDVVRISDRNIPDHIVTGIEKGVLYVLSERERWRRCDANYRRDEQDFEFGSYQKGEDDE